MFKKLSRRHFMKAGALGSVGASILLNSGRVHAAENNTLKIGLIGCGGRGSGALQNALNADPNTELVAVGDAFREKAVGAVEGFREIFEDRIKVTDETIFDGLECYKKVIPLCDVVLLCETPHFRTLSLRAAVEAKKHVFCEKPVAVDAPGIRSVMESSEIAKKNGTNLVSGLCWRYDLNVQDMMNRVKDGVIGEIVGGRLLYLTGKLWKRERQANDTEMKFQVRNWYNHAWLSGDFNIEQHVHTLDKALWAMGDVPPAVAFGLGARMQRTEQPEYGDIYDSMATVFEYDNGVSFYSYCRQQDQCWDRNDAILIGTKGTAAILSGVINDYQGNTIYAQERVPSDMYSLEHIELFKAIREGRAINNGDYMAKATMMGVLARNVCYTGKRITWDEALNSDESLAPSGYSWNDNPPNLPDDQGRYKISVPGMGKVIHQVVRS